MFEGTLVRIIKATKSRRSTMLLLKTYMVPTTPPSNMAGGGPSCWQFRMGILGPFQLPKLMIHGVFSLAFRFHLTPFLYRSHES